MQVRTEQSKKSTTNLSIKKSSRSNEVFNLIKSEEVKNF